MNTGPLNGAPFEALAKALRSNLPGKGQAPASTEASPSGLPADQSAIASQDPRYRSWENARPLDLSGYATPTPAPSGERMMSVARSTNWLSGKTLQRILGAVKRHLGGRIPRGTVITIRPRPGGRPGQFTVTVTTRRPKPSIPSQPPVAPAPKPQPPTQGGTQPQPPVAPAPKPQPSTQDGTQPLPPGGAKPAPAQPVPAQPAPSPVKPSENPAPVQGGGEGPTPRSAEDVRRLLAEPLPALPGPASGPDAKQNDLKNRAEVIKAIRQDAGVQATLADWDRLPLETRLLAGQRISDMMGKVYGFDASEVQIDRSLQPPHQGYFDSGNNRLAVSTDMLSNAKDFVDTVTHEQAHSYQHQQVKALESGKLTAEDPLYDTARSWAQNFRNYADPSWNGYATYRNQPVEAHAFATGEGIAAGVFS